MPANKPNAPTSVSVQTDEQLVAALQHGDRQAFAQLYDRYWADLFQVAARKLASPELAEELVQDLFISLWQRRDTLAITQVNRYLFSALKFAVIDHIRTQQVHERFVDYYLSMADPATQPEDALALQDLTRSIEQGLQTLPDKTQQVFRLSRFEHLTIPEIAARLNVSEKVVEYHLGNALRAMRNYLRTYGVVLAVLWEW
ncbi:RNA polymerase sigma-70 factor [Fibrella sp. HMF5335]|uniref:RNA polymerase sigma-70 factor n=1 Tax=Fibrella rubiginis TaxID=2817060 RepID=A0A939GDC4_9BACT|nr:RNA polymerase sigma-70 factor [Fibrella rubiginis]MBO0937017.1 RNA polymerase sigma-70 factor [Fibrella rubiginis]